MLENRFYSDMKLAYVYIIMYLELVGYVLTREYMYESKFRKGHGIKHRQANDAIHESTEESLSVCTFGY